MTVYLVGTGPGDPGLLTLRAADLLRSAEVVVHDLLVAERVLALAPPGAALHDVGRGPGEAIPEQGIDDLLVTLARGFERVVRLHSGDPYLFGRGGREALALRRAGVPFEVVPGVSPVGGALAYAGIPLTYPGLSDRCAIVSGGGAAGTPWPGSAALDWGAVARFGGTVAVLGGVAQPQELVARLLEGGRPPSTPAAVVANGTLASQRTVRTTLGELASTAPRTPAVIVVGEVAALDLSWFERRPLFGWRVIVTRSRQQAPALSERLAEAGAEAVEVPTIEIGPPADGGAGLRSALSRIREVDWVAFSSANAVSRVFDELNDARDLAGTKVAAIGKATAAALAARGVRADLVPAVAVAEELALAFGPAPPGGATVLLPQAAGAREALAAGLEALGYRAVVAEAYRTTHPAPGAAEIGRVRGADAICFSSSSTVEGFVAGYERGAVPPRVVTIGPVTSATARKLGLRVDAEAADSSIEGVVAALIGLARTGRDEEGGG